MSEKADRSAQCYDCSKQISGKKGFECHECSEYFCKEHVKINETDHSAICFPCYKKKIRLEVTLEMESELVEARNQLSTLKEKLKNCKKDLTNKKSTIERHENQIKINEKTYTRKFENLDKKTQEESQRAENIKNTISGLEATLNESKIGEKVIESKLANLNNENNELQSELDLLRQENNSLKIDINSLKEKSKKQVSYNHLRKVLCSLCKSKIKNLYREEILEGNKERGSIVASVLAERVKQVNEKRSALMQDPGVKDNKACGSCSVF